MARGPRWVVNGSNASEIRLPFYPQGADIPNSIIYATGGFWRKAVIWRDLEWLLSPITGSNYKIASPTYVGRPR